MSPGKHRAPSTEQAPGKLSGLTRHVTAQYRTNTGLLRDYYGIDTVSMQEIVNCPQRLTVSFSLMATFFPHGIRDAGQSCELSVFFLDRF